MEQEFDVIKWRAENPMDYIKAMDIINQSSNKADVFKWIYRVTRLHIPDKLYKYYSFTDDVDLNDSKLNTLQNKKIFMSEVKSLNDPFDSKAYFYRPEVLSKYERLKNCGGRLIDDFSSHIRVTCLTSNGVNSMPMWAHYANNHKGFCVEYDMRDRENLKLTSTTFPVQYTNKRVDITDLMDYQSKKIIGTIESHIALGKKEIIYNDLTLVFMESFFNNIKHETWSYENEYRCIVGTNISGMPYYDAVPKAIYIGINCEEYYKNQLMDIAKKININVFSMVLNEYSLDFNLSSQKVSTTR